MTGALINESTFLDALERACSRWSDRTALVHRDGVTTYEEVWESARAQARWYRELGVSRGDRILCALPNCPEHLVTTAAAWASGAVHVGVDHTLTVPELSWLVTHLGSSLVVVGQSHPDDAGVSVLCAGSPETRVVRLDELPRPGSPAQPQPGFDDGLPRPDPEEAAAVIFSSGTTGRPKGSVATHGRFSAGWLRLADSVDFGPDDVHLVQVPISHGYGLQLAMMALLTGGRLVLMERFSADEALELIARHRVTVLNGTPSHYLGVLAAISRRQERDAAWDVSSLRTGIGSADHFPPRLLARIFGELGMDFMNMYGSNMGFGVVTTDRGLMLRGSVGRPAPGALAIVDSTHRPLRVGEVGEIAFRYRPGDANLWNRPRGGDSMLDEASRWYYTGDLGRLDAEGNLYLSGRLKHQVNRGGQKIDPAEVVNELFACAGVADAAVIASPDDFLGEIVCACVVPVSAKSAPTLTQLREALGGRLAPYKLPEELCLVDEIPRTANGKVELATLKEWAGSAERRERVVRNGRRPDSASAGGVAGLGLPAVPDSTPRRDGSPEVSRGREALEQAASSYLRRLLELRAGLPGRFPAVLDEILGAAASYVREEAEYSPPSPRTVGGDREGGHTDVFLRPSLAASAGLREQFESLALLKSRPAAGRAQEISFPEALTVLVQRLNELRLESSPAEQTVHRLLLGCSLRALNPHEHLPRGRALGLAAIALASLARAQSDTVLYVGRPEFLTEELVSELQCEGVESRTRSKTIHHYCIADLGQAANRLAQSADLRDLVSRLAGPMAPNGTGKYVYCDEATSGVGLHIHTQPFAVNVELKLAHDHPSGEPGRLVLWPPYGQKQHLEVWPGELVVWFAGGVPHLREDPKPGESITAVSMFFEPVI
jgi:acyl-CoA synthetase (AMP-forming)/AMP-acid ligase II